MDEYSLNDLIEYLTDTKQKLEERGLEYDSSYWISKWEANYNEVQSYIQV